jgi:heparanase 1
MPAKLPIAALCAVLIATPAVSQAQGAAGPLRVDARTLPRVGTIDERFQSFQIGFSPINGGRTWRKGEAEPQGSKPDAIADVTSDTYQDQPPIDLANPRLRKLAAALGPIYVRYSGTSGNSQYFHDSDGPIPPAMLEGGREVLTRERWKGAVDFAKAIGAPILTSFAIDATVRDASGTWTPVRAAPWLAYTRSIGGEIYAAEMFNEPNLASFGQGPKDYDGAQFARDLAVFRGFFAEAWPTMKIAGPGAVMMRGGNVPGHPTAEQLMTGQPTPKFDIISYHFYGAVSLRCAPADAPQGTGPEQALSEEWLARADAPFQAHKRIRDRYAPGAPIWLTETGGAACGGSPWHATFLDSFRMMDQQARLAKQGLSAIFVSGFAGENYAWLDEGTFAPRPNYWAALLWRRLIGIGVLDAGAIRPGLHVYAHCLRGTPGGVTVLAINLQKTSANLGINGPAEIYSLTAPELQSKTTLLNGRALTLGAGDALPALTPRRLNARAVPLGPTSINFIALPQAANPNCR